MKNNHGANIYEIARVNNIDFKEIMDFSSNINPLGVSKNSLNFLKENLDLISTYPDSNYKDLKKSISNYTGADTENIILGLGSTELLINSIKVIAPKNAMILSPCYSEYENELKKTDANIFYFNLLLEDDFKIDVDKIIAAINEKDIELFIFPNPNNPTGSILKKDEIEKILKNTNAHIVVDETYTEFTDMNIYSSTNLTTKYKNLIITRGTSKFFASPGIRLGYLITSNDEILKDFNAKNILWQINIFADILGQKFFSDKDYIDEVFNFIEKNRNYMYEEIKKIKGLYPIKSYGNFILVHIEDENFDATTLRERLLHKLIVIRDCSSFKGLSNRYFRFCILKENDNEKLLYNLREIFK